MVMVALFDTMFDDALEALELRPPDTSQNSVLVTGLGSVKCIKCTAF